MKEDYKETPIGLLPKEWEVARLGDLTERITKGTTPTTAGYQYQESGINFIKVESITADGRFIPDMFAHIDEDAHAALERSQLQVNDVLFSIAGALGRTAIVNENILPANTNQALAIIRLKDKNLRHFIVQCLNGESIAALINKINVQTAQANLSLGDIQSFKIPLPPKPERLKIAEILSTVDEKIEVIGEQIEQTQELKKGLMQQLLTKGVGHTQFKDSPIGEIPESWEVVKLGDHVSKVGSGVTPKGGSEAYVDEGVLFIRSQNVLKGKLKLEDVAYITPEQHNKMSNSQLHAGDVLLNITGASIGRSCIVPNNVTEGNVNQHVCIIRHKNSLNNHYLCQLLNSYYGQTQINRFQAGGNREGLNFQQIRSFIIPLPKIEEQNRISDLLLTVDEKLEVLENKRTLFQVLKKGLMQQLLTGRLRVNHLIEQTELA